MATWTSKITKYLTPSSIAILLCLPMWAPLSCSLGDCKADPDCPLNRVCANSTCVVSCEYNSSRCTENQICVNGHCQTRCLEDTDCDSGYICDASGLCFIDYSTDQETGDGSEDDGDADGGDSFAGDADTDSSTDLN